MSDREVIQMLEDLNNQKLHAESQAERLQRQINHLRQQLDIVSDDAQGVDSSRASIGHYRDLPQQSSSDELERRVSYRATKDLRREQSSSAGVNAHFVRLCLRPVASLTKSVARLLRCTYSRVRRYTERSSRFSRRGTGLKLLAGPLASFE
jgi:hypothetical protein